MVLSHVVTIVLIGAAFVGAEEKVNASTVVKDETNGGTPWLPFFGLNTFPYFSFSGLGLPQRPFAQDALQVGEKIKATKTEYIEITRRQTVHPVCYTTYENKSPCLPYRSNDEEPEMDVDVHHEINQSAKVKEAEAPGPVDMSDYMKPVMEVLSEGRHAKYLRFNKKQDKGKATSKPVQLQGSETTTLPAASAAFPFRRPATEYVTTTVLLTKLEKYTDHRVTATMVALNCLPADPAIRKCRKFVANPIVEVPLHGKRKKGTSIIITPAIKFKSEPDVEEEPDVDKTVDAVKKAAEEVRNQVENLRRQEQDDQDLGVLGQSTEPGANEQ